MSDPCPALRFAIYFPNKSSEHCRFLAARHPCIRVVEARLGNVLCEPCTHAFLATAQEILNEDMPVAPIVFGKAQIVYAETVSNVNYTVFGYTELENVQPG